MQLLYLVTDQNQKQFNIHFYGSCLNCLLRNHAAFMEQIEDSSPGLTFDVTNAGTLNVFLKRVVTSTCKSFRSIQGIKTVNSCLHMNHHSNYHGFWNYYHFLWLSSLNHPQYDVALLLDQDGKLNNSKYFWNTSWLNNPPELENMHKGFCNQVLSESK